MLYEEARARSLKPGGGLGEFLAGALLGLTAGWLLWTSTGRAVRRVGVELLRRKLEEAARKGLREVEV